MINIEQPLIESNPFNGSCYICFCPPNLPVITQCGHIYCWPCIFRWLNSNRQFQVCPVCKNGISQNELIPIYTRQDEEQARLQEQQAQNQPITNIADNDSGEIGNDLIPPRPIPTRRQARTNQNAIGNDMGFISGNNMFNIHNGNNLAGYGYFPPVFFQAVTTNIDPDIKDPNANLIKQSHVEMNKVLINVLIAIIVFMTILM